ncbi:MAG: helix-turn-helix transcriptional regulator [Pedococcus sp.]
MSTAPSLSLVSPSRPQPHSRPELQRPERGRPEPHRPEPLWREVVGARLRHLRRRRGLTLAETARRAGISPQYLSEVERGRKDPSSEVLAAISGALDAAVVEVTHLAALDLRRQHSTLAVPPPGEIRLSA